MTEDIARRIIEDKFGADPTYEDVRRYLFPRLMRAEQVDSYELELVCISKGDFYVTFYVLVEDNRESEEIVSFPVTMGMIDKWSVAIEDVLTDAVKNAEKMFPLTVETIEDVLDLDEIGLDTSGNENTFYVMSNQQRHFGAATMLYKSALKNFEDRIGEPFYVIPSSVHELILIPQSMGLPARDLRQMLLDVNHSVVRPEDELSQYVYYYDSRTGTDLRLAEDQDDEGGDADGKEQSKTEEEPEE